MCERWWCCFCMSGDCACPKDEYCPMEDETPDYNDPDTIGDMMYHQRVDEEICHV